MIFPLLSVLTGAASRSASLLAATLQGRGSKDLDWNSPDYAYDIGVSGVVSLEVSGGCAVVQGVCSLP